MLGDFANTALIGIILFGLSLFEGMLTLGLGSVRYYAKSVGVSKAAIDQFNGELPPLLSKIYGFTEDSLEGTSTNANWGMILWGMKFPVFFIVVGIIQLISELQSNNIGAATALIAFLFTETLSLLYFLRLGKRYEKSKERTEVINKSVSHL